MKNPLTKIIDDIKYRAHINQVKSENDQAHKNLLQGQITEQEAEYIRAVVMKALTEQAVGSKQSPLSDLITAHNSVKESNPESIVGLDTFGLVAEAMVAAKRSDLLDNIRAHGTGISYTRVISDMASTRSSKQLADK